MVKKLLLTILCFAPVVAIAGCEDKDKIPPVTGPVEPGPGTDEDNDTEDPNVYPDTVEGELVEVEGDSTLFFVDRVRIDLCTPNQVMYIVAANMFKNKEYVKETTGVSDTGIVKQDVSCISYKYDGFTFFTQETNSSAKKTYHNALLKEDTLYRNSSANKFEKVTLDEYVDIYGFDPSGKSFTNHILNDETILDASLVKEENGIYTYEYNVSLTASPGYAKQIKVFGGLEDDAAFTSISIKINVDKDFNLFSYEVEENYKSRYKLSFIPIPINCKQVLTTTIKTYEEGTFPAVESLLENFESLLPDGEELLNKYIN